MMASPASPVIRSRQWNTHCVSTIPYPAQIAPPTRHESAAVAEVCGAVTQLLRPEHLVPGSFDGGRVGNDTSSLAVSSLNIVFALVLAPHRMVHAGSVWLMLGPAGARRVLPWCR